MFCLFFTSALNVESSALSVWVLRPVGPLVPKLCRTLSSGDSRVRVGVRVRVVGPSTVGCVCAVRYVPRYLCGRIEPGVIGERDVSDRSKSIEFKMNVNDWPLAKYATKPRVVSQTRKPGFRMETLPSLRTFVVNFVLHFVVHFADKAC